ncbi:MAG: von Willebrand factor type A domain-containing protein [Candidatus Cryptobacteroides sp.]|nr:von Willebrand factor type A domain-containing protein [Candidatus Cryptobacteroides sp.]
MKKTSCFIMVPVMCLMIAGTVSCMMDYADSFESVNGHVVVLTDPDGTGDKFDDFLDNPFIDTEVENVSTFSVDADGAAYAYMRRMVNQGFRPTRAAVRIEEYLNYFTFDYPDPAGGKDVAINAEVGACPWQPEHKLLRLGIKGRDIYQGKHPKSNYVFLLDISGSMATKDKLPLLQEGMKAMIDYLDPDDRISIVTYASGEKKVLESTPVREASKIKKAIGKLVASGSTAGHSGMRMAYEECLANYIEGGNNRVIMGTDGDFNVGETSTDAILELAENYAAKGIYLTVCGFGTGNLNDSMMERVSNAGNGTYEYIDSEDELTKVFVIERNKFTSVANDVKNQVTFDKEMVKSYRLIGYENRVLGKEDFDNDKKDAGEIGASQTITALYEIVPAEGFAKSKVIAKYDLRYKEALGDASIPLTMDIAVSDPDGSSANLDLAAGIAAYGMMLRQTRYQGSSSFAMAHELVSRSIRNSAGFDPYQLQLRENLLELIDKADRIKYED